MFYFYQFTPIKNHYFLLIIKTKKKYFFAQYNLNFFHEFTVQFIFI